MVGARIRSIRRAKRMTQNDLAKAINRERSVLARYERGETRIDSELLLPIATALGVRVEELFKK